MNQVLEKIKLMIQKIQRRISALKPAQSQPESAADEQCSGFKGKVLVCEDDDISRQVIQMHLSKVGIKAETASNGKEGVLLAKARMDSGKPFDLIFMDIHMPEMDGLEAAEQMRKLGVMAPVVALTSNITESDKERYKASGISDCLGKPFKARELWDCLCKYLTAAV